MIKFLPFKAIRPTRDKAYLVATRSYVSYTRAQLADKLHNNPYSFLHIIHAVSPNKELGAKRYVQVKEVFDSFVKAGFFIRDKEDAFYLYEQAYDGRVYRGWIGAVSMADYKAGKIKVHENTLTKREKMFRDYLHTTGFNAEPVLLAHQPDQELQKMMEEVLSERAEYEFTSTDRITHKLWVVNDPKRKEAIQLALKNKEALYIADGHHRSASSALLAENLPEDHPAAFCMAYLISSDQLTTKSFFRLVKANGNKSLDDYLSEIEMNGVSIEDLLPDEKAEPAENGCLMMTAKGRRFRLSWPKSKETTQKKAENLPPALLYKHILKPVFSIEDDRNDKRLQYEPAEIRWAEVEKMMQKRGFDYAFYLPTIPFDDVIDISDQKEMMPPKSTYIEPKLRSGLVIYDLGF